MEEDRFIDAINNAFVSGKVCLTHLGLTKIHHKLMEESGCLTLHWLKCTGQVCGPSLQNRHNVLRILGEQWRNQGEHKTQVACKGRSMKINFSALLPWHATRASHSPCFHLCSSKICKNLHLFFRVLWTNHAIHVLAVLFKQWKDFDRHPLVDQATRLSYLLASFVQPWTSKYASLGF